jgi:hypothetical protein
MMAATLTPMESKPFFMIFFSRTGNVPDRIREVKTLFSSGFFA